MSVYGTSTGNENIWDLNQLQEHSISAAKIIFDELSKIVPTHDQPIIHGSELEQSIKGLIRTEMERCFAAYATEWMTSDDGYYREVPKMMNHMNMNRNRLMKVGDPIDEEDAVNKDYMWHEMQALERRLSDSLSILVERLVNEAIATKGVEALRARVMSFDLLSRENK